jgi:phosphatidylglycerophosphate synthase
VNKYSIEQIRSMGQPASVMNRRIAEHWSGPAYMRKASPYLSKFFLNLKISPTSITWLMVFTGWIASYLLTNPALWAVVMVFFLAQLQMLLDCSDGEVARVREKFNPAGIFVDRIGHYTTESFFAVAFSIRIYQNGSLADLIWGFALALLIVYNKVLNDLVHVTRGLAGLSKLPENPNIARPSNTLLQKLRSLFRFLPIHRAFHSIELSTIFLVAALIQFWLIADFERLTLQALTIAAAVVVVGHTVAILNSSRLKA